jgi:HAD superfamily hydrolase (TIGR01484 family)
VDPFEGQGLLDFLPRDVSKAYALKWWSDYHGVSHSDVVFAGDSGNDLAALTAGFCAILVANADRGVAREA